MRMKSGFVTTAPTAMPRPGGRARKVAKWMLVLSLIFVMIVSSTGTWLPGLVNAFASLFPSSQQQAQAGCAAGSSSPLGTLTGSAGPCSPGTGTTGLVLPQGVDASKLPDLALPQEIVSGVGSVDLTGVAESTAQNLTVQGPSLMLNMLGGSNPHDELVDGMSKGSRPLLTWSLDARNGMAWIPIPESSSNFTIVGTNNTGTTVVRSMAFGHPAPTAILKIAYVVTPTGELSWSLTLSPTVTGDYRLDLSISQARQGPIASTKAPNPPSNDTQSSSTLANSTLTQPTLAQPGIATSSQLWIGPAQFSLSWADVPSNYNTTATQDGFRFILSIDLGSVPAGSSLNVDPSLVGSDNDNLGGTTYPYQHHVYQDPKTGYYWIFYHDPSSTDGLAVKYSPKGDVWFTPSGTQAGSLCNCWARAPDDSVASPAFYFVGETVIMADGAYWAGGGLVDGGDNYLYMTLDIGTFSGTQINWKPINGVFAQDLRCLNPYDSNNPFNCYVAGGIRYVSVATDTKGRIWLSVDGFYYTSPCMPNSCGQGNAGNQCYDYYTGTYRGYYDESYLYMIMIDTNGVVNTSVFAAGDHNANLGGCYRFDTYEQMRSVVLPADTQGGTRIVFQGFLYSYSSDLTTVTGNTIQLYAQWYNGVNPIGLLDTIEPSVAPNNDFSAVSGIEDGTHVGTDVVYRGTDGNITYAYRSPFSSTWAYEKNIFNGVTVTTPVVTTDYSTGDVYVFGTTSPMKIDGSASAWCDHTTNSCQATLTTTNPNDLIIVYPDEAQDTSSHTCTFSVKDSAGLTWSPRGIPGSFGSNIVYGNSRRDQLAEYFATSSSQLTSDTITESILNCAGLMYGGEYNGLMAFAISGANLNTPFDPNPSLAGSGWSNGGGIINAFISTGYPNDMVISGLHEDNSGCPVPTPGAGFVAITATGCNMDEYQIFGVPVTSYGARFNDTVSGSWEQIADAVEPASAPAIVMKMRTLADRFADHSLLYPVTQESNIGMLETNFFVASASNSSNISLIWSEPTSSSSFNVMFAALPVQTVWSPYGLSVDPWDGNGVTPYGQYFQSSGEYVSPNTGMLSVEQTDLSLLGRGLDLDITRVYTEPYSFLSGQPYNFDPYPWAPMGDGWQLNFPWMNSSPQPLYLHLANGQGYRIPASFWFGGTATFENHQGENFRLVRYTNGTIVLLDKSGTTYVFGTSPNPNHALMSITDATGNNTISFNYSNNLISCISDTVQRPFVFSYWTSPVLLQTISQVNGSCANQGSAIRTVTYVNNGQSLTSVTDPAGRITSYSYSSNPWLLSQITYPTGWYDTFTVYGYPLGTEAMSYRVIQQETNSNPTSIIRQFAYTYTPGPGGQVLGTVITDYNGTQVAGYTKYSFSFFADVKNVTDANGNLLSGDEQFFASGGEISKDVKILSDGQGHFGSYTNYYSYDLWGNQIYSRETIGSPTFTDNFANGDLSEWTVGAGGPWTITSGAVESNSASEAQLDTGSTDWQIATVQAQLKVVSGQDYSIDFVQDGANFYRMQTWDGYQTLRLYKEYSGGYTQLASATLSGINPSQWHTWTITISGGTINLSIDGVQYITYNDPSPYLFGGITLRTSSSVVLYKNVQVVANQYHETFNSYYDNGEPPGNYAFQETFSRNQGTEPDNSWNVTNGYWMVNNGVYNGTPTTGPAEGVLAYSSINKADISIQARVYLSNLVNTTADQRFGIFTHYAGGPLFYKWALVIHAFAGKPSYLEFLDEWNQWLGSQGGQTSAQSSCSTWTIPLISKNIWYTFNMTVQGTQASGWVSAPGQLPCYVTGTFQDTSPAIGGMGFGLYASTYSALFDDVQVTTVSPFITGSGFSNSFIQNGAPGPVGLNTWLVTTKPPAAGWNTTIDWLPASQWNQAYPSVNYGGGTWASWFAGWTDLKAQWIWSSPNANVSAPLAPVWFRRVFSLPSTTTLNFNITCDDVYTLYLDGTRVGAGNWANGGNLIGSYLVNNVSPGYHILGIFTNNTNGPDPAGLLVSVTNMGNKQVIFRSDATAGPNIVASAGTAQLQNGPGSLPEETYYGYNLQGRLNQTRQLYTPQGGPVQWLTTTQQYDIYGNIHQTTDPQGNSTTYAYSTNYLSAYLTSKTQTLVPSHAQITSSYGYNFATGTMAWSQEPNGYGTSGYNTTRQYDVLGRLTRVTSPTGDYQAYAYNDAGNYVDITDENGLHTRQFYDGLGRLAIVEQFNGSTSYSNETYTYNWMNQKTTDTSPVGNKYSYQYDALGREVSIIKPDGTSTQTIYNSLTSQVFTIDENGVYTCNVYDRLGRLLSVVQNSTYNCQAGIVTNYYYDEAGNLLKTTTSNNQSTIYFYDNLNRLIETSYSDSTSEIYSYDSDGNLTRKVDRKGTTTQYFYDSLNRLLSIAYPSTGFPTENYTYDNNGNLIQLASQNGTISYTYDTRDRMLTETYAVNTGFGMTPSPSALTIEDGSSAKTTITLASFNGFAGPVTLSAAATTYYASFSFSPSTVTLSPGGTGATVLTVSMSSYATAGTYSITVTGYSAGESHSVTLGLTVTDFSIVASPPSTLAEAGSKVTVTLSVQSLQGYSGSISLAVLSGLPACASSPTFTPSPLKLSSSGTNSSTLTFNLASSCAASFYSIEVAGTDGTGLTHYALFSLTISGFSVSISPVSIGIQPGYSGTINVTLTSLNQYSGSVQLSTSGLPSGVTSTFSPNPVSLNSGSASTSTLTLSVAYKAPSVTSAITVKAADNWMSRNVTLTLAIGSYVVAVSPSIATIFPGGKGNVTVSVSKDIGFSSSVTLSLSGTPSCGVGSTFTPSTITFPNGGTSILTLSVSSSCAAGNSYTLSVSTGKKVLPTTFTLTIADFTISANPTSLSDPQGAAEFSSISLTSKGLSGYVALTATISPVVTNGPSTYFNNPSLKLSAGGSNSTSLELSASCATPIGSYTVTVTGTSGLIIHSATILLSVVTGCTGGGGGGGGGSVALGTLILLASGATEPVQNIKIGDQVIVYNVPSGYETVATVEQIKVTVANSSLTIHTADGLPFRADANPLMKLWVLTSSGPVRTPITQIVPGNLIYNYDEQTWVRVTDVKTTYGGQNIVYDLITNPDSTSTGQILEYIANGYPDCPTACKTAPTPIPTSDASLKAMAGPDSPSPQVTGSVSYTVSYSYNGELVSSIIYPDGFSVSYFYDALGRLTTVSQTGYAGNYASIVYNQNNQPTSITYGNGLVESFGYTSLSTVSRMTLSNNGVVLLTLSYSYIKTGLVASVTGSSTSTSGTSVPVNEHYAYDALGRLTASNVTSSGTTTDVLYKYDTVGNRIWQSVNGTQLNYLYNQANNELNASLAPRANTGTYYGYGSNGAQTSKYVNSTSPAATTTYTWDPAGNLVEVASNSNVLGSYAYDADNRRIESVEASTTTLYAYLGTNTLYEQIMGRANVHYVYASGLMIANVTGTTVSYYHTDTLGSTRLVTNAQGAVIFCDNYQPFGQDNGASSGNETYKFTGKPESQTTGLYYEYARWYDPTTGRFISQDPVEGHRADPQSLNPYVYVENSPSDSTDPTGMADCGWNPLSWGGCAENAGGAAWGGLTTAGGDVSNWYNGLSPQQKTILTIVAIVAVTAVAVVAIQPELLGVDAELGGSVAADLAVEDSADLGVTAADVSTEAGTEAGAAGSNAATNTLASTVARNAILGGGVNSGVYSGIHIEKGDFSWRGLAASFITGAVGGALGTEGVGLVPEFGPGIGTVASWLGGNIISAEGGYLAGQAVLGKAPTLRGLENTAIFAPLAGIISDASPGFRGAVFGPLAGSLPDIFGFLGAPT
jgi:RHS repeat-associated protein